jgi:hypothetical protein
MERWRRIVKEPTGRGRAGNAAPEGTDSDKAVSGKRTLTDGLTRRTQDPEPARSIVQRTPPRDGTVPAFPAVPGGLADAFDSERTVHAAAAEGVKTPSQEVPYRSELEPALGQDLSFVRAHVGGEAEQSAQLIRAEAYAQGDDVVLPANPSKHTVAHEVAHVLQQRAGQVQLKGGVGAVGDPYERHADAVADRVARGESAADLLPRGDAAPVINVSAPVQRQESPDAGGPVDAGVPLPAGVVDPTPRPPANTLPDLQLGSELAHAEQLALSGSPDRQREVEDEIERRIPGILVDAPGGAPTTPANTNVTPEVAVSILDNVSRGQPPFKPELGKGGASWFVSDGQSVHGHRSSQGRVDRRRGCEGLQARHVRRGPATQVPG